MPVSWQTRFFSLSATWTFLRIVFSTRWPGTDVSLRGRVRERVAEVLRDVLQRPDVEVRGRVLDGAVEIGVDRVVTRVPSPRRPCPARRPKTQHSSRLFPIIRLRPCVPPAISPHAKRPSSVVSRVRVDDEPTVLVVEDRVGEDRLRAAGRCPRRGSGAACTGARSRRRAGAMRVVSRQTAGRPSGVVDALALLDLVEDRLRDGVARAERVGELLAVRVEEHGAVRARRLRDRVALHVRRPGAAVRVVLERVEVARLRAERRARSRVTSPVAPGWFVESSPRSSRLAVAAARRRRGRRSPASSVVLAAARPPAVSRPARALASGDFGNVSCRRGLDASRSAVVIACPVRSPTCSSRLRVAPPQRASR